MPQLGVARSHGARTYEDGLEVITDPLAAFTGSLSGKAFTKRILPYLSRTVSTTIESASLGGIKMSQKSGRLGVAVHLRKRTLSIFSL